MGQRQHGRVEPHFGTLPHREGDAFLVAGNHKNVGPEGPHLGQGEGHVVPLGRQL